MKVLLKTEEHKEIEIKLPFYSQIEGDDNVLYVKITDHFYQHIKIYNYNMIEIFKSKFRNVITAEIYENKCSWKQWQEAVRNAKDFV